MIRVVIADDSSVTLRHLTALIDQQKDMRVVATAKNGKEAVDIVLKKRPDIVIMDVMMPKMSGYEATRLIMEVIPTPIIIITATFKGGAVGTAFQTIDAGAVACLEKPKSLKPDSKDRSIREFIRTVRAMSEVKVVRRRPQSKTVVDTTSWGNREHLQLSPTSASAKAVVIGGSTGAPPILHGILAELPANFPFPILVVQHIAHGFIDGMVDWLRKDSKLTIQVAKNGETLKPGVVYLAPDDRHLTVGSGSTVCLSNAPAEHSMRPAVSVLFRSALQHYQKGLVGILLSGMGSDGSAELKAIRDSGGLTIVQDEASCVVFGMPGRAVEIGGAENILPPSQITELLVTLANRNR